jgi:hypothetical protein
MEEKAHAIRSVANRTRISTVKTVGTATSKRGEVDVAGPNRDLALWERVAEGSIYDDERPGSGHDGGDAGGSSNPKLSNPDFVPDPTCHTSGGWGFGQGGCGKEVMDDGSGGGGGGGGYFGGGGGDASCHGSGGGGGSGYVAPVGDVFLARATPVGLGESN